MTKTPLFAQLTIAFDGSQLRCEGSSDTNGSRAKIEGIAFRDLPLELRDWLDTRLTQLREREAASRRAQKIETANYVAKTHGKALAERCFGELAFSVALDRFRLRDTATVTKGKNEVRAEDIAI